MEKDFRDWNSKKSELHAHKRRPQFREREIWFASLGANIGFEEDGKGDAYLRPVVILKKFNNEICWGIPTTKKDRTGRYYFQFSYKKDKATTAILSQLRLVDSKRLMYKLGFISKTDYSKMKERLASFLK